MKMIVGRVLREDWGAYYKKYNGFSHPWRTKGSYGFAGSDGGIAELTALPGASPMAFIAAEFRRSHRE
jgi:hypothetical protein